MAAQILFSQLLAVKLSEWKGASERTVRLLVTGLTLVIASAVAAGYAGSLAG